MLALIADGRPLTDGVTTQQLDDDRRADGAVRVPRRVAGRRRRQGHRSLQADPPGPDDHRGDGAGPDPDRRDAGSRRARTTCTGTTRTSPPRTPTVDGCAADPIVYPPSALTLHWLLYGSLDDRKSTVSANCPPGGRAAAAAAARRHRLQRLEDGDHPPAGGGRGDDGVLRSADAARGERAGAVDPAGRLLHHAGVLRELADQHQQPDARHAEPDAHRRARRAGRRHAIPRSRPAARRRGSTRRTRASGACFACHQTLDPAAVDLLGDLLVELPQPARPGADRAEGAVRVPGRRDAGRDDRRSWRPAGASTRSSRRRGRRSSATTRTRRRAPTTIPSFSASSAASATRGTRGTRWSRELLSSPITTNASATTTYARQWRGHRGAAARSPVRRAGQPARASPTSAGSTPTSKKQQRATIPQIVSGLPSDGYGRGSTEPGAAEPADAVLSRRHREHLRRHRRQRRSTSRRPSAIPA